MTTRLEEFPNELFFEIFRFIDIRDIYRSFFDLNRRFNQILCSLTQLSLIVEKNDSTLINQLADRIVSLHLKTWHQIDFRPFVHLKFLTLHRTTRAQVTQIRPEILPNLVSLSVSLAFDFWSSSQLAEDVFSNAFRFLRHADLGRVDVPFVPLWSISPHLHSLSICSNEIIIIPLILISCPNLRRFRIEIFGDQHRLTLPLLKIDHQLKHLSLSDSYGSLQLANLHSLLSFMPMIEIIELTLTDFSLAHLLRTLAQQLHHLERLDIYINELIDENDLAKEMNLLRRLHPSFHSLQLVKQLAHGIRYFTNKEVIHHHR